MHMHEKEIEDRNIEETVSFMCFVSVFTRTR